MTRSQIHAAIALGSTFTIAAVAAFAAPPVPSPSNAAQAERICEGQGIRPASAGYEYCMSQAVRALEWGEPELAYTLARVTADARDACLSYGLQPTTSGYHACIERETHARALLVFTDEQPKYGPQIAEP